MIHNVIDRHTICEVLSLSKIFSGENTCIIESIMDDWKFLLIVGALYESITVDIRPVSREFENI